MATYQIKNGDCRIELSLIADCSVDSVVCDPPYELGFMGKTWDRSGIAYQVEVWRECLRVLKHGGYLLAFGGSRTCHRLACAIEDAGFEIRDQIQWLYGSGFPKSLDVSKAIDAAAGVEREVVGRRDRLDQSIKPCHRNGYSGPMRPQELALDITAPTTNEAKKWNGWGTALKPAHEPIVLARKPLIGTVAENVLQHGTGGLNIEACRIGNGGDKIEGGCTGDTPLHDGGITIRATVDQSVGRWPANVIHDGSEEVLAGFPSTETNAGTAQSEHRAGLFGIETQAGRVLSNGNAGSAARFFYCAKASREDREDGCESLLLRSAGEVTDRQDGTDGLNSPRAGAGRTNGSRNHHPTVKPTDLMRYLCRLVTPPNGTVLDPFCGSGSTGRGAVLEGFNFIGIELDAEYCAIAEKRIATVTRQGILTFA